MIKEKEEMNSGDIILFVFFDSGESIAHVFLFYFNVSLIS